MLIAPHARGTVAPRWSEQLAAPARWALTGLFPAVLVALDVVPAVALGGAVPARTLAGIHLAFLCGGSTPAAPYVGRWLRWRWPCRRAAARRRCRRFARSGGIVSRLHGRARRDAAPAQDQRHRRRSAAGGRQDQFPALLMSSTPTSAAMRGSGSTAGPRVITIWQRSAPPTEPRKPTVEVYGCRAESQNRGHVRLAHKSCFRHISIQIGSHSQAFIARGERHLVFGLSRISMKRSPPDRSNSTASVPPPPRPSLF